MLFSFHAVPATFIDRPNRYVVHARLDTGQAVVAHCADPGRLKELLIPGVRVYVSPAVPSATGYSVRATQWDLRFVSHPANQQLISLDTRVPNALFAEGLAQGFFPQIALPVALCEVRREVPLPLAAVAGSAARVPHSRADFRLTFVDGSIMWVEVKSASLVVDRMARFPDAVTERGRRHLIELAALARGHVKCAVVFIVQRPDADSLEAHRATDPSFADSLDDAHSAGVQILAATCHVSTTEIHLERSIPVRIGASLFGA